MTSEQSRNHFLEDEESMISMDFILIYSRRYSTVRWHELISILRIWSDRMEKYDLKHEMATILVWSTSEMMQNSWSSVKQKDSSQEWGIFLSHSFIRSMKNEALWMSSSVQRSLLNDGRVGEFRRCDLWILVGAKDLRLSSSLVDEFVLRDIIIRSDVVSI